MRSNDPPVLMVQRVSDWFVQKWNENRIPFLSALIFAFLAHTFSFTNKLINHDEVYSLFSKGATVVSGRWGLGALDSVFPNVSMPWIYGVITIVLLAISVCFLVSILRIRCKWMQVLTAGLVLTFPSLTGTFGYLFTSSSYGVAFLLAVGSVWLLQNRSGRYWLGAILCMVLSLSIYQSYISLTAAILVLVLIRQLLEGEDVAAVFRRGIAYVLFLILSLGLYFGLTQLILGLKHVQMGSYAADSLTFNLRSLPGNIAYAYRCFFLNFREDALGLIPTAFSRKIHLLLMVCAAILLMLRVRTMRRNAASWLLMAGLIGVFPLAVNCMYLFTAPESIHTLVQLRLRVSAGAGAGRRRAGEARCRKMGGIWQTWGAEHSGATVGGDYLCQYLYRQRLLSEPASALRKRLCFLHLPDCGCKAVAGVYGGHKAGRHRHLG